MMMSGAASMTCAVLTNPVFGRFFPGEIRKDIDAAGRLNDFRDPADPRNHWLVPFLEIHLGATWPVSRLGLRLFEACRELLCQTLCGFLLPNNPANHSHHVENSGDDSLIEGVNLYALADEGCHDLRLQIREREDEVGLKRQDFETLALVKAETRGFSFLTREGRTA
jgi:hypothetical protein